MSQGVMSMKMSSGIWMNSTVDTVAVNGTVTASIDPNGRNPPLLLQQLAESLMTMTVNIVTPSVPRNLNATSGDSFVRIGWGGPDLRRRRLRHRLPDLPRNEPGQHDPVPGQGLVHGCTTTIPP